MIGFANARHPGTTYSIFCLFMVMLAAEVQADPIVVAGGDQVAWAILPADAEPLENPRWRLFVRLVDSPTPATWIHPLVLRDFDGQVRASAVRGRYLHVFFDDGTHRIFSHHRSMLGMKLPLPVYPLAMCGDDDRNAIYVVVPKHVADAISPPVQERRDEFIPRPERPDDAPGLSMTDRWPDSKRFLLIYERGRWRAVAGLPADVDAHETLNLAAHADNVYLIFGTGQNIILLHGRWRDDGELTWQPPETICTNCPQHFRGAMILGAEIAIVVGDARGISLLRNTSDGWLAGDPLRVGGTIFDTDSSPISLAAYGQQVVGIWKNSDAVFQWAQWPANGGDAVAGPDKIPLTTTPPPVHQWRAAWVSYAVLAMLLLTMYVRRSQVLLISTSIPPEWRLAGHGRRAAAFLIDALIMSPAVIRALGSEGVNGANGLATEVSQIDERAIAIGGSSPWLLILAAYIAYAMVFELWWGATPGKRLLHCRVINENGQRSGAGRIIIRNLMRVVEMYPYVSLVWTLMLILFTRNRQRFGDLIGKTMVVERRPSDE